MEEAHLVLLNDRELNPIGENIVIFKATFHSKEVTASMSATFRTDAESQCRVLESFEILLVEDSTAPVIVFLEHIPADFPTTRVTVPSVAHLSEHLQGIRIGQFMFIAERGIQCAVEKEATADVEVLVTVSCMHR